MISHVAWPKDFFIFNYNEIDTFFFFLTRRQIEGEGRGRYYLLLHRV